MFRKLISCLSSNSKKVLAALLSEDDPVSAQHLADELDLSISQVRYSIKKIEACLIFKGIEINQKPNEGIAIVIDKDEKKELLDILQNNKNDFGTLNQGERVQLILQIILTSRDKLTLQDIRSITEISYTSFYRDMEKVKAWFNSFSLTLTSKRNGPFNLAGGELKIREAIQEILFQNLGQDFLLQACVLPVEDIEINDMDKSAYFFQIQDFIREMNLPECEKQIRGVENKYGINLFDRVHIELTLYLGIMTIRLNSGKYIQNSALSKKEYLDKYKTDVLESMRNLSLGVEVNKHQDEIDYLGYLFSQCFEYGASNRFDQDTQAAEHIRNSQLAKEIVKEIAKYLHAGLYEDKELTNCVEWELAYALRISNMEEINSETSRVVEDARNSTEQILFKILPRILQNDGIANLLEIIKLISNHTLAALERIRSKSCQRRVLLVCGSGIATAFSLRSQLNTQLPEIDVVDMVSVFELVHDAELIDGCDAIISTVPLGNITRIPQIHVNSLLKGEDIESIKNTLELDISHQYNILSSPAVNQIRFGEVFSEQSIRTQVDAGQPVDVIDKVGSLLLEIDAIWPSYIKAMKNLYTLYGPYMVIAPNTALLHAGPEMGSKKLAISLITLEEPINFGHKTYDPIKIAMAFSSPVNSVQTNTLSGVFNFFAIPGNRLKILTAQKPADILSVFRESEVEFAS